MPRVLKEFEEVIGRLVSISGHRVLISCGHDEIELLIEEKVLPKLSQLLGQRIAILRLEDRYHIRLLRERTSTSETLNNSSDELPMLKHFPNEEIPQKLRKFLGHKIGLLKLGHIFYIRIISGNEEHTAFYHSQDVEGV